MMSKFKFAIAFVATIVIGLVFYVSLGTSQSPQPTVRLVAQPPIAQIVPFEAEATREQSPVKLTLQALDIAGKPLHDARIHLQILTPKPTPWFTTDFPIVEGTKLLDMEATAKNGELHIQQMFPIRGTYQLSVNVSPLTNEFSPFEQTLTLSISENPAKFPYLATLVVILLGVGLGGGLVMGGHQQVRKGEIAPYRVRLLLSGLTVVAIATLSIFNTHAEMVESHAHSQPNAQPNAQPQSIQPDIANSKGLELKLIGDDRAIVGKASAFKVRVVDTVTGKPASNLALKVVTTQLEDNWTPFAFTGNADANGQFIWQQQFFDGAPHKITAEVIPSDSTSKSASIRVEREVEVLGVAPPLARRFTSLAYFIGIIALGLIGGLWLRGRRLGKLTAMQ